MDNQRFVRPSESNSESNKILKIDTASEVVAAARAKGRTVVLAHGVFDLLHLGHVRHLELARKEGDFLVVSITADAFVNKGPGRPVFPAPMRAEMLAALAIVDVVVINDAPTAIPVLRALRPTLYVKGMEYADASGDVTGKIVDEREAVEAGGGHLVFTDDVVFSSSSLINRHLDIHDPKLREYLEMCRSRNMLSRVLESIDRLAGLKVLLVGDAIIDEYQYVATMGKAPKENMIATRFIDREMFAGGVLAAANHVSSVCAEVEIITCLGATNSYEEFIRQNLKPNVRLTTVMRPDAPTTRKCRFVDPTYYRKLFETYYFEDKPLPESVQTELDRLIAAKAPDFDLVIVADFGHGMIARSTIDILSKSARFLAVNSQSNSANFGFNLVTKYPRADFVCIDAPEARLSVSDKDGDIEHIIRDKLAERVDCPNIIVTHGKNGCVTFERGKGFHHIPAFTKTVVDTVGAGDAFLSITSPLVAIGTPLELVGFVGNAVGAIKVGIVGHRHFIEKAPLVKSITALLK